MVWYNRGKHIILDAAQPAGEEPPLDLLGDVIWVALMRAAYTIDIDAHDHFADTGVSTNEIVATGYVARGDGRQLASKTTNQDNTNDRAEFDAADLTYTAIGNGTNDTFNQIIIGRDVDTTPTNANANLIAHAAVASTTTNGGDITLVWNAEGILHLT